MRVLSISSGSKPAKKGSFVTFPTTTGSVKLSSDLCLAMGIAKGDYLQFLIGEFDESDNLPNGIVGNCNYFQKMTEADEKTSKFGTKSGAYLAGSVATAWGDARSASFAGQEVSDKQVVTYDTFITTGLDGQAICVLVNAKVRDAVVREGKEVDEDEDELPTFPTNELVEEGAEAVEQLD